MEVNCTCRIRIIEKTKQTATLKPLNRLTSITMVLDTNIPLTLIFACVSIGMLHTDAVFDYFPSRIPQFYYYKTLTSSPIMIITLPVIIGLLFVHLLVKVVKTRQWRHTCCFGNHYFFAVIIFCSHFSCCLFDLWNTSTSQRIPSCSID